MKKTKQSYSKKEKIVLTISIILIVISVIVISTVLIRSWKPLDNKSSDESLDSNIATPKNLKSNSINILFLGIDETSDRTAKLTDVIMVLNFDLRNDSINILQIPRDTYVGTSEVYTGKINGVYSAGKNQKGIQGISNVINKTFGLPLDYYVSINMDGFVKIVDTLGGVEMDVPEAFNLEGIKISKGVQLLDGIKAEKFVRVRSIYNEGDIGRVKAQRIFMAAFADKLLNMGTSNIIKLIPDIVEYTSSNMNIGNISDLAKDLSKVSIDKINIHILPGVSMMNGDQSVYSLYKQQTIDLLNNYFRPHTGLVFEDKLNIFQLQKDSNSNVKPSEGNFGEIIGN